MDLYNLDVKLMPISIDKIGIENQTLDNVVLEILKEGSRFLNIKTTYGPADSALIYGYDEAGYGVITDNERNAIQELAQSEGVLLDPVYSGRAFYGMVDYLKNNRLEKGANVLFWHTGGLPANFYYFDFLLT